MARWPDVKDLILVLNDFAVIRSVNKLKNLCL